jgi:DNA-binding response OmpR family regulator
MNFASDRLSIVVVEDEPDIADLLALYFRREQWDVFVARNGEDGLNTIRARRPDFVVLDIGLPGRLDGLAVCAELRATSNVPVLFLTAREDEVDRLLGLELGADDYVVKPFSPREIVARAKAILRRGGQLSDESAGPRTSFDSILIDSDRKEVSVAGKPVPLATQEWSLLEFLVENIGMALSRQQILDGGWGHDWIGDPRTVDVHIRQLRKKLGEDLPLDTVRGVGYRLG